MFFLLSRQIHQWPRDFHSEHQWGKANVSFFFYFSSCVVFSSLAHSSARRPPHLFFQATSCECYQGTKRGLRVDESPSPQRRRTDGRKCSRATATLAPQFVGLARSSIDWPQIRGKGVSFACTAPLRPRLPSTQEASTDHQTSPARLERTVTITGPMAIWTSMARMLRSTSPAPWAASRVPAALAA
jgi:hypothetical protein